MGCSTKYYGFYIYYCFLHRLFTISGVLTTHFIICSGRGFSDFNTIPTRITRSRRSFSSTRNHRSVNNNILVPLHRTTKTSNEPSTVRSYNCICSVINARSVRNRSLIIKDLVVDNSVDILAITETWLCRHGDDAPIGEIYPSGYRFAHNPRLEGNGDGVGLLFKSTLNVKTKLFNELFRSSEYLDGSFINLRSVNNIVVYRAPISASKGLNVEFWMNFLLCLKK